MELYKEKYFDHRTWILENMAAVGLTMQETVIVLLIDLGNQYNEAISVEYLAKKSGSTNQEVDAIINSLFNKGLLTIKASGKKIIFDISNLFIMRPSAIQSDDIFELFETEFKKPLSQNQMVRISEWLRIYDKDSIIDALREASINEKLSLSYIEKILAAHEKDK